MAEGGSYIDSDKFKCPVCLDLMRTPVTIPCGHSYCMLCISRCWDKKDSSAGGPQACPQCRHKFTPRPKLAKNALLAELVEKLREERRVAGCSQTEPGGAGAAGAAGTAAGGAAAADVPCDVCIGAKAKATRSCLVCLASYCEQHLRAHYQSPAFRTHRLITAAGRLQDRICPQHNKLLEFYCQSDKLCVCYVCMFNEHKGHNVVSAETERATKKIQKQLAAAQQSSQQKIRTKEKELKELKQTMGNYKNPVKSTLSESCSIRDSLIKGVKQWQTELEKLIKAEESKAVSAAQSVLAQQEQVLADLKKRDAELQQLCRSDDHVHFLKNFEALCEASPDPSFDTSTAAAGAVVSVRERLEEVCSDQLAAFSRRAKEIEGLIFVPKTRTDFLRYACTLTFDVNTVNGYLELNHKERTVMCDSSCFCPGIDICNRLPRPYPPHPERFDHQQQVLCKEPLYGGRFYWEIEGTPLKGCIGVCYGSIPRKEHSFLDDLTNSQKSWCVECGQGYPFAVRHGPYVVHKYFADDVKWESSDPGKNTTTVGMFLDHSAGILSFYLINKGNMYHMYTFRTTFTEPLYVGLRPCPTRTLKLCSLEPPAPVGKSELGGGI
ncbi:E3 ubiquitin-protein ligase TRIM47-like [Astyanax mexicanus]|uniref:E3 ubiquitin-protein ligase TRIM47-like n=1 Tax=Astyanax mexicanus TaxID=7994 RepID=UPI0020CB22F7|nr:E3 ubiquitin-protein ligase TRIM47-like [Astyanax mexicanus]